MRDTTNPQELGEAIMQYARFHRCSYRVAADAVLAPDACSPVFSGPRADFADGYSRPETPQENGSQGVQRPPDH